MAIYIVAYDRYLQTDYEDNMSKWSAAMKHYAWNPELEVKASNATLEWLNYKLVITELINNVQKVVKCCGFEGPQDWAFHRPTNISVDPAIEILPSSCCEVASSWYCNPVKDQLYESGCRQSLEMLRDKTYDYIVLGKLIMSLIMAWLIRNYERAWRPEQVGAKTVQLPSILITTPSASRSSV